MSIDIAKACDGTFYPFSESIVLDNELIENKIGEFVSPISIKGTYVLDNENNVYIESTMQYDIKFPCDRCLKEVIKHFDKRFTASYYLFGNQGQEGYYPYNNNSVDLTDAVKEEIVLNIPSRILCDENCKGLCPHCGINLNEAECNCKENADASDNVKANNPFAALKDLNNLTGGASNGSTKA